MEKAALIGKNISGLIPINDKVKILADFRKMFDGEISEISSKSYKLSGESSTVEINAMKITYKDIPAVILNVREV